MATTTQLPTAECNNYDYVIVGGGTAGRNDRMPKATINITDIYRLCYRIATCGVFTSQKDIVDRSWPQ